MMKNNKKENKGTNKSMKKVDFFTADREFSDRVVDYMVKRVWRKEFQLKYSEKIGELYEKYNRVANLKGSALEEEIEDRRKEVLAEIAKQELQRKKDLSVSRFEDLEADKAFKRTVRASQGADAVNAVRNFYQNWGLDISDSYFEEELISSFGKKSFSIRTFVKTNGESSTTFNVNDAWGLLYTLAYERMVQAGTIKPVQIPEIIRDKYAPKKKVCKNGKDKNFKLSFDGLKFKNLKTLLEANNVSVEIVAKVLGTTVSLVVEKINNGLSEYDAELVSGLCYKDDEDSEEEYDLGYLFS